MLRECEIAEGISRFGCLAAAPRLAHAMFGTADAAGVAGRLDAFCARNLGSAAREVLFCELSVGAAFGLRLLDDRRVLVKAHRSALSLRFLRAVHAAHSHLARSGFPCPLPVAPPAPFGDGFATVEELVEAGAYADARDPRIRRASAGTLARLVRLSGTAPGVDGLGAFPHRPPRGRLWPEPHSPVFDFAATVAGSGWIEGHAARAKRTLDAFRGGPVVGHADWCSKHLRFRGGDVSVVYDWDSLRIDAEPAIVGRAAVTFPANRHLDGPNVPEPDETWRFVRDYEEARGRTFSRPERWTIAAGAVYALSYLARCEHAADPEGSGRTEYRLALPEHAAAYFRTGA